MSEDQQDFRQAWQLLLQDCTLAENYHLPYQVSGSPLARNPILEELLPSFAFIRVVSFADEALAAFMTLRDLTCTHYSKKGELLHEKKDLFHRTECLAEHGVLAREHAAALHCARVRRRPLAHESDPEHVTWKDLRDAVNAVEQTLAALEIVEPGVRYEALATQHRAETETGRLTQRFTLGLTGGGRTVREIEWRLSFS